MSGPVQIDPTVNATRALEFTAAAELKVNQSQFTLNYLLFLIIGYLNAFYAQFIGGTVETAAMSRVTASGSVTAGARSVTFICSQIGPPAIGNGVDFAGSILGVSRNPGESLTIAAQSGATLGAIAYTIAGGSLDILTTT